TTVSCSPTLRPCRASTPCTLEANVWTLVVWPSTDSWTVLSKLTNAVTPATMAAITTAWTSQRLVACGRNRVSTALQTSKSPGTANRSAQTHRGAIGEYRNRWCRCGNYVLGRPKSDPGCPVDSNQKPPNAPNLQTRHLRRVGSIGPGASKEG